ncbi:MAG: XTP/dITP diphosphatase [Endomicrobium sp.]|jgi:XTP/dITP diphosphohydrolase|nr:XTP/dITP diphosphatase [Endomicrobium sp.]
MIDEIIIATRNMHKVAEIKDILSDLNIKVVAIMDFPNYPRTVEDGKTLEENAVKKAKEAAAFFKKWVIADDTGLEVEYLNGEPGVFSARYAGESCTYEDNNKKLLSALKGVPADKRGAHFRCVIAISNPEGETAFAEGEIFGIISENSAGEKGFGYDPIFFLPEQNKTFAQLDEKVKNSISHRSRALQKAKEIIKKLSEKN